MRLPLLLSARSPLLLPGESWGRLAAAGLLRVAGFLGLAAVLAVAGAGWVGWP